MSWPQFDPIVLDLDSPDATLERVGGKGASLARMAVAGLCVPTGFHVTTLAYRRFVAENRLADAIRAAVSQAKADDLATLDRASAEVHALVARATIPDDIAAAIRGRYDRLGTDHPAVAVRSSATAEDLPDMSFAGQQETYLNVRGGASVVEAVQRCFASLWTARAIGYRARQNIADNDVAIAVVVQQLVAADVSGILFTANPLSGSREEIVVNAAWGLGEAIVGGRVTPDMLVLDKRTGAIVSQAIAVKEVMTTRLSEGTGEEPVPNDRRRQAALQPRQAAELARLAERIERLYGQPMDVEWALSGPDLFALQARPITALPEPRPVVEWKVLREGMRYARSSVIELLPDPLSPLFATLALPSFNDAMTEFAESVDAGAAFRAMGYGLVTINGYAYYEFRVNARMLLVLPLMLPKIVPMMRQAERRWREARQRYAEIATAWSGRDLPAEPAAALVEGARRIVKAAADHYLTIQSGILPVAYMSEAVFTRVYERLARRASDPPALAFMLGFDSEPIRAERSLYDLAAWVATEPVLAGYLQRATSAEIAAAVQSPSGPLAVDDSGREFCRRLAGHLARFGHAVYDLDFAKSLPSDDPAPLLEALKYFLAGRARSPHERQAAAAAAREEAARSLAARLGAIRRRAIFWLLDPAQRYAPLRENALADVGLGWPAIRRMFHEVGRRMVAAGALSDRDEVFWLRSDEIDVTAHALDMRQRLGDYTHVAAERRAAWERERMATPPVALPVDGGLRMWGIDLSRWMPARTGQAPGGLIRGIGASPGRVSGAARLLHGPAEFGQMRPGEILVAKITTPAWTSLFALASGVVTDVGGPLSHSSIVAREYHIPAVLGTGVATERIRSGERITVDGDAGLVTKDEWVTQRSDSAHPPAHNETDPAGG